jgi:hypothetical protein
MRQAEDKKRETKTLLELLKCDYFINKELTYESIFIVISISDSYVTNSDLYDLKIFEGQYLEKCLVKTSPFLKYILFSVHIFI